GTWYNVGLGACGHPDVTSSPIVAISHDIYGNGGDCNQWMQITNKGATRPPSVCVTRSLPQQLYLCLTFLPCPDLSPSLFKSLGAPLSEGVIEVEWHFMAKRWNP
ncbi:hypothetical protein POSPLADRAFT_1157994, partial [Postia placenta MAD-698-R-SB12]